MRYSISERLGGERIHYKMPSGAAVNRFCAAEKIVLDKPEFCKIRKVRI
jgi:hypothetical protein